METGSGPTSVEFDNSPAESFLSAPSDDYSSLFAVTTPSATSPDTMNPMEMMTPQSFSEDKSQGHLTPVPEEDEGLVDSEKKPTKKRKSWGQVLPEPKTNLPPRKRAKTEDEKEQRRVERVLRNRRAAQSSRERKRLEVEALEKRNKQLEELLINAQKTNLMLVEELNRFRRTSGVVTRTSTSLDSLHDNSVTLSQELFSPQIGSNSNSDKATSSNLMNEFMNPTVNPASLSPELAPVPDSEEHQAEDLNEDSESTEQTSSISTDLTQRPAVMLCDLPCRTSVEMPESFPDSQTSMTPLLVLSLHLRMMLLSASAILSACQRPLIQIAMSSKAGFSLLPSPQLLTTIIWLVTIPPASRTNLRSTSSTSTTSSTTRQPTSPQTLWQRATAPLRTTHSTSRFTTLRLKSLRNILSSSPNLARPLLDATMEALRLVSEGRDDHVETVWGDSDGTRDVDPALTKCLKGIKLPSKEVLITLLWALKIEERRIQRISHTSLDIESGATSQPTEYNFETFAGVSEKLSRRKGASDMFLGGTC